MTKTVNLNVNLNLDLQNSDIVDIAWECANKYVA